MKITFLVDNKTEDVRCDAEWGLSMAISANGHKVLYDVGGSDMFSENASNIGVDLREMECCMISHGHYDHTNGLEMFCEINENAPVYMHKDGFNIEFAEEDGVLEDENCGIQLSEEFLKKFKNEGRLVETSGIVKINESMTLVGDIPVPEGYKLTEKFFKMVDGKLVLDSMNHEQFLAVSEEDKVHIISGCSHKGIINILNYAQKLFPEKKIVSLVGGFHTYPLNRAEREKLIAELISFGVEKVVPLHCTGMNMIISLKEKMGEACIIACAGDTIEL